MKNSIKCLLVFIIINFSVSQAQLNMKRDDYVGNARRNWWKWHDDGPSTPMPSVENGFVLFTLIDPVEDFDPYCDAAMWDGSPLVGGPYNNCTVLLRAKALNPHLPGSRGWGLWYTEGPPTSWYTPEQNQAWFIHSADEPGQTDENWWRVETAKGIDEATHHYVDLDLLPDPIDDEEWHTYKIIRETEYVRFYIDGSLVLEVTEDIPDLPMAFHIWVDNLVYEYVEPGVLNIHKRGWTGKNEIVLDFVQILTIGTPASSESPSGIKLLREIPNEMGEGQSQFLWKNYSFNSTGGNTAILVTGRVEQYLNDLNQPISDDDDIRLVIDGQDYGWETANSFNADAQGTVSKTLLIEKNMTSGTKNLDVYGDITPLLYDVTVLGSTNGGLIVNNEYNETAPGGTDYLWKEITFPSYAGEVAIYISGTADEDPNPTRFGRTYDDFDDALDDDLRIVLDGTDYGYKNANSLYGNRLFGEPKSILIKENISEGNHTLRLYANGTPTLYRVAVYGEFYDESLPVSLSSFEVSLQSQSNLIEWQTESEVNNLGFNIYKAVSSTDMPEGQLNFYKLNTHLISGAGNSNQANYYSFEDKHVQDRFYYWYQLEDMDFNGNITRHPAKKIFRGNPVVQDFELSQNYPNPFNQETTIEVKIAEPSSLELRIFAVNGELIYRKDLGERPAGNSKISWNGKDMNGKDLPSGVYYYQIQSRGESKIKPMVLLK